jgi:hypothetical protein
MTAMESSQEEGFGQEMRKAKKLSWSSWIRAGTLGREHCPFGELFLVHDVSDQMHFFLERMKGGMGLEEGVGAAADPWV